MYQTMNKESQDELTAEQFRRRLYCLFEKRGVVDYLKTQMRHLLVEELQECVPGGNILKKRDPEAAKDDNSLLLRAANSLVANHLQKNEYEYTMGIFVPESGTYPDKMFSTADLLQLLHINPSSELYKRLVSQFASYSKKGFLWQLLCQLSSLYSSATVSASVQTDFMPQYSVSTLDEKLNGVERIYRSKKEKYNENAKVGLEEKLVSLQRQLEERYETELQMELTRMKENDLVRFRIEEKEKCRKELELSKKELEKNYQIRLNALRERERNFTERLQKEEQMQCKETYIQRQSLLEEISALRERDAGITRTLEGINREKSLHEEKMRSQEELLRQKLNEVNRMEMEYHQRLKNEINKFKIEEQKKLLERSQDLDKRETQVKAAELQIADSQMQMQLLKEEIHGKNTQIHELEILLQEAHRNELKLVTNNNYLKEMMDLNEKNSVSKKEFENVKMYHSETMQLTECLRTREEKFLRESLQLNQEMATVKQEMERVREELNKEKILYENYKKQLDERLHKEITQNRKLLQKCDEQTQEMQAFNQEMTIVQHKLLVAQKALNNEVAKKKKRICSRSLSNQRACEKCSHRPSRSTRKIKTRGVHKCLCSDESCDEIISCSSQSLAQEIYHDAGLTDEEMTNEDSSNIIAEIKYEKKMLEEQMKNIQHGYKCFQDRLKEGVSFPARNSVTDEAVCANILKTSKKNFRSVIGGHKDFSPVQAENPDSASRSPKTLASTPRKDSSHSVGKRGHSISALPRFDISQLTGEDENRSVDEDSPIVGLISDLNKPEVEEKKVDEANSPRAALPTKPSSSAMLPTSKVAAKAQVPSSLVASPPIPDIFQTVSSPTPTSSPPPSAFVPISVPLSTSAINQVSAPPPASDLVQISAPLLVSAPLSTSAINQISAPPLSSDLAPISALQLVSDLPSAPISTSVLAQISTPATISTSPLPAVSALPPISATFPKSSTSALISAPLSQLSSPGPSYPAKKSPLQSFDVVATPLTSKPDSVPLITPAMQPLPVVSLDDAWGCTKNSEGSAYQSKSSNAKVSEQQKDTQHEIFQKKDPEEDDVHLDTASSSCSVPGLESSVKEEEEVQKAVLNEDVSSQIETEIESDILPGSDHSNPVLDLASQKESEKPASIEDKPKLGESELEEIHSESLSQSHMSDSEVDDDMFENW